MSQSWTTPIDAVDGTTAEAAWFNSTVNDNLRYLQSALVDVQPGSRNRVYNGNFSVWQAGTSNTTSTGWTSCDGWYQAQSGGGTPLTVSQQALGIADIAAETGFYLRTATTLAAGANTDYASVSQPVEDVRLLAHSTVTVSFYAKASSGTPKVGVSIDQNFGSGGSPSATVTGTGQAVTLSTTLTRYQVQIVVPSVSGKALGSTANSSYSLVNLWLAAGSTLNTRSGTVGLQTATIDIWGVQVEYGSVMTSFEREHQQVTLSKCQRYWCSGAARFMGQATLGTSESVQVFFPVLMSKAPTVAQSNTTAISFPTTPAQLDVLTTSFVSYRTASVSAGGIFTETWTASARLI